MMKNRGLYHTERILSIAADKDAIIFTDKETGGKVIYNPDSFKKLLKGIMIVYANKSGEEADAVIEENSDFFIIKDSMDAALVSHELPYHWAMLFVYGNGYHQMNGCHYPPPDAFYKWESEYMKENNLNEPFIFVNDCDA